MTVSLNQVDATLTLAHAFRAVRARTLALAAPLAAEDTVVQSMPDTSPTKWHLAHTTWFFEEFVLQQLPGQRFYDDRWRFLFNSYYQTVGPMHARPSRGLLSRPRLDEVLAYRAAVDDRMADVLERGIDPALARIVVLGIQHEQQHQELILTDIKHVLACNPLLPTYRSDLLRQAAQPQPLRFIEGLHGAQHIGINADAGFSFDCEQPRHTTWLSRHALASRPVSCGDWLDFIADGGYAEPRLWLSEGWDTVRREEWRAPLYWDASAGTEFTLGGVRNIERTAPVAHVSYFEADAFARWAGARLPTEAEWECAAVGHDPQRGNFVDADALHPMPSTSTTPVQQLFGDVWEWTASPYVSYPGYRTVEGALGEYNGKFMCGQWVLRGGSCATPAGHLRASYRNFFPPHARWQFSGLRLAKDA